MISTTVSCSPPLDFSTLTLSEATPSQVRTTWRHNGASWAGKLSIDDYLIREHINGTGLLTGNGGIRYWIFVATDDKGDGPEIYASCETLKKQAVVKLVEGYHVVEQCWAIASVYTPPKWRGRGVAREMLRRLKIWLDGEEAQCSFSVLYSDVGEYYSRHGWQTFSSPETSLPVPSTTPQKIIFTLPSTKPLTATDLFPLCKTDVAALTKLVQSTRPPLNSTNSFHTHKQAHTLIAFLPTYAQATWHFGAEDFIASKIFDPPRAPTVKGAAVNANTWCYWVHDYSDDALTILRIVSPSAYNDLHTNLRPTNTAPPAVTSKGEIEALASLLYAAQKEAAAWSFHKVVLWDPSSAVLEACKLLLRTEAVVRTRTEKSVPCLRWKGTPDGGENMVERGVEWIAIEKYSWC